MAEKLFKTRIKQRRDTSANWESKNPVLLNGEVIIVDIVNGKTQTKIGNGTKTYTQLPFDDEGLKVVITHKLSEKVSFGDNYNTSAAGTSNVPITLHDITKGESNSNKPIGIKLNPGAATMCRLFKKIENLFDQI